MSTTSDLGSGVHQHTRWRLRVSGLVQGVGFRPFVQQLAHELGLTGWVENSPQGMTIEIEGFPEILVHFQARLTSQAPGAANIHAVSHVMVPIRRDTAFLIRASHRHGSKCSVIPPDLATCSDCLTEITDPGSRRYRYPFTTCTQCGPRYSIVESIPFDRDTTTMKKFPLCKECQAEYQDITDRRFHAEAITCPNCGPQVALWDSKGNVLAEREIAISQAGAIVRQGEVLAVKGLGGFQLIVDARNPDAVNRLRGRKHREEKPFALMFPTIEMVCQYCDVSALEERLLTSPASNSRSHWPPVAVIATVPVSIGSPRPLSTRPRRAGPTLIWSGS